MAIPTEESLARLRRRTVVAGAIAFVVPFGLFLLLASSASERYVRGEFSARLSAGAATNAALLDSVLHTRGAELEALARQMDSSSPQALRQTLADFTAGNTWYENVFLAGADGEILAAAQPAEGGVAAWPGFAPAASGQTVVSAASGAPFGAGTSVALAAPAGGGRVLAGVLRGEPLRTRLLDFGMGETEDTLLASEEGILVAPSRRGVPAGAAMRGGGEVPPADNGEVLSGKARLARAPFYAVVQVNGTAIAAPVSALRQRILLYVAPFLGLGVALAWVAWHYAMRRIERLARDLMQAVLVARQHESERDRAVQQLARRLEEERELARQKAQFQAQLAEYEKYAALGQLALGAAHEINNPLMGILSHLELERKYASSAEVREEAEQCIEGTKRIALTLRSLLNYARPGPPQLARVGVERLVADTLAFLHHHPLFRQIQLESDVAADVPPLTADPTQLSQILMNLLLNAAEAMTQGGRITVGARHDPAAGQVRIWVEDDGPGIPADVLPHVFQPFFTTKKGKGTGLGLSITQAYVRNHGGEIRVDSAEGRGARVEFTLPIRAAKEAPPVAAEVVE